MTPTASEPRPLLQVAPSPHIGDPSLTTRRMMVDVALALLPALGVALWQFGWYAVAVVGLSVLTCMATEALAEWMRGRTPRLTDGSALVTGLILGLSMPWSAPAYVVVVASAVAIGVGKMVFGGLGMNLFNPAMVGRAFVTLSFAQHLGAGAYVGPADALPVATRATPLTEAALTGAPGDPVALFLGAVNGSLGETSALALLVGGLFLCVRRTAAWEIPAGVLAGATATAALVSALGVHPLGVAGQLFGGSLILGAFFIATDPCSSPVTRRGRWVFGAGVGALVICLRAFSSYPEGVMFAILIMNATVPLINRWTIPVPLGGIVPPARSATS